MKTIIYGGGTISHVRSHLALCAPAFGTTARYLKQQLPFSDLRLTRMASESSKLITNADIHNDIESIIKDSFVKFVVMNAALCDFAGNVEGANSGPHAKRLETSDGSALMELYPTSKLIQHLKAKRPDIFIVGFKTTTEASLETMVEKSRKMDVDLVMANDTVTRKNILYHNLFQSTIEGERKNLLDAIAGIVRARQGDILYEDDKKVIIQLPCFKKLSLIEAEKLAVTQYEKETGRILVPSSKQWSSKQDGAIILTR